jgi:hypothetical protein
VGPLVSHILLALAAAALLDAGFRAASLTGAQGLERGIAAAVLAAAAAVVEALGLGLAAVGTSQAALTAAALATWLAARVLLPAPQIRLAAELRAWWAALSPPSRLVIGGALGAAIAWSAWLLRHPALGHDMILYHVPEALTWIQNGHPGSIEPIVDALPVGAYPLTHEVLLSWGMGISRGFAFVSLLSIALTALLATATWSGLRRLGVGRTASTLAAAALVLLPATIASQSGGGSLDPAATAWLCACAALCAGAWRGRVALVCPAVTAAGLAAGTKTTALPLALVLVGTPLFAFRRSLRSVIRPLAAATAAALIVGGYWYARDLVLHGSPLWPFKAAPWGDPRPALYDAADVTFLERPGRTLSRLGDYYVHHFAGGIALLVGAFVAPLLAWRREVIAAAAVTLVSLLLWATAPFTGVLATSAFDVGTGDATRYLLPGLVAAALTLGLAERAARGWRRLVPLAILGGAALLGARDTLALGFPSAPSLATPLAGAAAGAVTLVALGVVPVRARWRPGPNVGRAVSLLAVVAAGTLAAVASHGYIARHADAGLFDAGVTRWFTSRSEWRAGRQPVAVSGSLVAPLAGDSLRHPLRLVRSGDPCEDVSSAARQGWVVLTGAESPSTLGGRAIAPSRRLVPCLGGRRPVYSDTGYSVYRDAAPRR